MGDHDIARTHRRWRGKQAFFVALECSCGWRSTSSDRLNAREEFFEHRYPNLSIEQLIEKYATPPYTTSLTDLLDRYGKGVDPP